MELTKNINIVDNFPFLKKHPYFTLAFFCAIFNFAFAQETTPIAKTWITPLIFVIASLLLIVYLEKTVDDFVLSPRAMIFISPVFALSCAFGFLINQESKGIFLGTALAISGVVCAFFALKFTKRLTAQNTILLIFITGFIIRLAYAFYTPIAENSIRQHDVWRFISGIGDGLLDKFKNQRHAEYIEYIAKHLSLPDVNPAQGLSQLYHPPLHHIIAGLFLRLNIELGMKYKTAVEAIQLLTVLYSSSCMITAHKIFKELGLTGNKLIRATAIISLFPWFFLFAGGVNNDMLSIALGFATILVTIRWYKNPKISNLLQIAVFLGLAMFTKLSMGLLAPAIAYVFLVKFISVCKKRDNIIVTKKGEKEINPFYMVLGFSAFALIVFPLGLGWQVKNLILWDMPLTYIPSLSKSTDQYVGSYSVFQRFFGVKGETMFYPFLIWGDQGDFGYWEYNLFTGGLKTALFGEDTFFKLKASAEFSDVVISTIGQAFCTGLYVFGIGTIVHFVVSFIKFFKNNFYGMNKIIVRMLLIITATFFGNYIVFCFGYPFTCTMNFRYLVPVLILFSLVLGTSAPQPNEAPKKKFLNFASSLCIKGFCALSAGVYMLLALMPY